VSAFFERPADRVVAGAIDDVQLHYRGLQQFQGPPRTPLGRLGTSKRDQLGLGGAIEDALSGRAGRVLAGQGGIQSALHQLLAGAGNGVDAGLQRLGDLTVALAFAGLRGVGLPQDACFQELAGRCFTLLDQRIEPLALVLAELDDILLYGWLFRGRNASPGLPEVSIRKSAAESTTRGTRLKPLRGEDR
jgi:hypothetical protein